MARVMSTSGRRGNTSDRRQDTASVSAWLFQLREGDEQAAAELWDRYFPQLVNLAREQLRQARQVVLDGEDAALSALDSFFRANRAGRFLDLKGRDELWRLLTRMTRRKAIDLLRRQSRLKRGGGNVLGESALLDLNDPERPMGLDRLAEPRADPQTIALLIEAFQKRLAKLEDPVLQTLALGKLEGHTNDELASRLGCSLSTVERRLYLIRQIWLRQDLAESKDALLSLGDARS